MAWTVARGQGKRKGTLSDKLLDMYVDTGVHRFLDMARDAQAGRLGQEQFAKAWKLVGAKPGKPGKRDGAPTQRPAGKPRGGRNSEAEKRAIAAEQKAKDLEARLAALELRSAKAGEDAEMDAAPATPTRRPAPEIIAAEASARATVLQESATRLRAAGLIGEAEPLEVKAAELLKKSELPSRWKRLDMKEAFVKRAEGRVLKGTQAVEEALQALDAARNALQVWERELEEAHAQLTQLRNESDDSERTPSAAAEPADVDVVTQLRLQLSTLESEASRLREQNAMMLSAGKGLESQLAAAKPELQAAREAKLEAERKHIELRGLGSTVLTDRLAKCFTAHQQALNDSQWQAAENLAETTGKLTAALREASANEAQCSSAFNPES